MKKTKETPIKSLAIGEVQRKTQPPFGLIAGLVAGGAFLALSFFGVVIMEGGGPLSLLSGEHEPWEIAFGLILTIAVIVLFGGIALALIVAIYKQIKAIQRENALWDNLKATAGFGKTMYCKDGRQNLFGRSNTVEFDGDNALIALENKAWRGLFNYADLKKVYTNSHYRTWTERERTGTLTTTTHWSDGSKTSSSKGIYSNVERSAMDYYCNIEVTANSGRTATFKYVFTNNNENRNKLYWAVEKVIEALNEGEYQDTKECRVDDNTPRAARAPQTAQSEEPLTGAASSGGLKQILNKNGCGGCLPKGCLLGWIAVIRKIF